MKGIKLSLIVLIFLLLIASISAWDCELNTQTNTSIYYANNNELMWNAFHGGFVEQHILCYNYEWYEIGPTWDWNPWNGNFIPLENVVSPGTKIGNWTAVGNDGIWIRNINNTNTNQTNPNINQTNPNINQTNPNINQTNPNINQTNPNINQTNPNTNQTNPNTNQTNPNTNQTNPNTNQTNPNNKGNKDNRKNSLNLLLLGREEYCTENWKCSDWSSCDNGIQTRSCIDLNSCEFSFNKPLEVNYCESSSAAETIKITPNKVVEKNFNFIFWISVGIAILLILIVIVYLIK